MVEWGRVGNRLLSMEIKEVISESAKGATHGHWGVKSLKKLDPKGHRSGMIKTGRRERSRGENQGEHVRKRRGWVGTWLHMSSRSWEKVDFY